MKTFGVPMERELDWKLISRRLMAIVQFSALELRDIQQHPAALLIGSEAYSILNWQAIHN